MSGNVIRLCSSTVPVDGQLIRQFGNKLSGEESLQNWLNHAGEGSVLHGDVCGFRVDGIACIVKDMTKMNGLPILQTRHMIRVFGRLKTLFGL